MAKKKRRRQKPTAKFSGQTAIDLLSNVLSGIIVAAILKLLHW